MFLFDMVVARHTQGRWLLLHACANFVITAFGLVDFYSTLADPVNSCHAQEYSLIPVYGIAALHLYHLIAFRNLSTDEWVHHLLFGGCICSVGCLFRSGKKRELIHLDIIFFFPFDIPFDMLFFFYIKLSLYGFRLYKVHYKILLHFLFVVFLVV